ncbi:MAG: DUF1343 domain-containing protein, partial [Ferruginibacter sp.]|nr:DUF1343 domain-containing protein [Cytophagales bacterium]
PPTPNEPPLLTGAEQLPLYLPDLRGKRVAMVVNHTSLVGNTHLVDTLLRLGVKVNKIFAPEHGFRGDAANGEHVANGVDIRSQLPIVSLYGSNRKPRSDQLTDVDAVIFDIQDVGTRFFTYIGTMHYVMEACAENGKRLIVLDRPNPNGDYVDGPVLDTSLRSFIGMHPVPIVHGLTVGEMAMMINGEKWLAGGRQCALKVIKNAHYTHQTPYLVTQRPSPNLPNALAVRLYPSLCLFEGTTISVGRGTDLPFLVIGAPDPRYGSYAFTPRSRSESKYPPHENQRCYGLNLSAGTAPESIAGTASSLRRPVEDSLFRFLGNKKLTLSYLLDFYQKTPDKPAFFNANNFFDMLAGTRRLRQQIQSGMTEAQIRDTWQADLGVYRRLRANYLLYPD